ncbi:MAG: hypothetical protein HN559_28290 [Gemmatimonadetes bacterium]|jgi:ectoine hydroxylase-related dioxygenase (phytanoyl-CoA dioxygenase family)|nr:hypothetical protein [Gemmatimonadota bacterium]MBT7598836.1 hypothetical protein [Gemmatimonadota bacterium]
MTEATFDKPFPALTPAQRYHLEVFGYVVIEETLSADEVGQLLEAVYRLKRGLCQLENPLADGARFNNAYLLKNVPNHHFIGNILESDPAITAYATHPRLVSMAEELMACEARIVEMNAHVNSRVPEDAKSGSPRYRFHRGTDIPFGGHVQGGLFHCNFVKTLTNLTDLSPEDGGTVVIAGSHKVDVPQDDLIELAYQDPSLIHQVVAPAGSTLLFSETLIHATGQIRSDKERVIIITGYGAPMFPYWDKGELSDDFREQIPEQLTTLFHGKAHWGRSPRYRTLAEAADARPFAMGDWNDRPTPDDQ